MDYLHSYWRYLENENLECRFRRDSLDFMKNLECDIIRNISKDPKAQYEDKKRKGRRKKCTKQVRISEENVVEQEGKELYCACVMENLKSGRQPDRVHREPSQCDCPESLRSKIDNYARYVHKLERITSRKPFSPTRPCVDFFKNHQEVPKHDPIVFKHPKNPVDNQRINRYSMATSTEPFQKCDKEPKTFGLYKHEDPFLTAPSDYKPFRPGNSNQNVYYCTVDSPKKRPRKCKVCGAPFCNDTESEATCSNHRTEELRAQIECYISKKLEPYISGKKTDLKKSKLGCYVLKKLEPYIDEMCRQKMARSKSRSSDSPQKLICACDDNRSSGSNSSESCERPSWKEPASSSSSSDDYKQNVCPPTCPKQSILKLSVESYKDNSSSSCSCDDFEPPVSSSRHEKMGQRLPEQIRGNSLPNSRESLYRKSFSRSSSSSERVSKVINPCPSKEPCFEETLSAELKKLCELLKALDPNGHKDPPKTVKTKFKPSRSKSKKKIDACCCDLPRKDCCCEKLESILKMRSYEARSRATTCCCEPARSKKVSCRRRPPAPTCCCDHPTPDTTKDCSELSELLKSLLHQISNEENRKNASCSTDPIKRYACRKLEPDRENDTRLSKSSLFGIPCTSFVPKMEASVSCWCDDEPRISPMAQEATFEDKYDDPVSNGSLEASFTPQAVPERARTLEEQGTLLEASQVRNSKSSERQYSFSPVQIGLNEPDTKIVYRPSKPSNNQPRASNPPRSVPSQNIVERRTSGKLERRKSRNNSQLTQGRRSTSRGPKGPGVSGRSATKPRKILEENLDNEELRKSGGSSARATSKLPRRSMTASPDHARSKPSSRLSGGSCHRQSKAHQDRKILINSKTEVLYKTDLEFNRDSLSATSSHSKHDNFAENLEMFFKSADNIYLKKKPQHVVAADSSEFRNFFRFEEGTSSSDLISKILEDSERFCSSRFYSSKTSLGYTCDSKFRRGKKIEKFFQEIRAFHLLCNLGEIDKKVNKFCKKDDHDEKFFRNFFGAVKMWDDNEKVYKKIKKKSPFILQYLQHTLCVIWKLFTRQKWTMIDKTDLYEALFFLNLIPERSRDGKSNIIGSLKEKIVQQIKEQRLVQKYLQDKSLKCKRTTNRPLTWSVCRLELDKHMKKYRHLLLPPTKNFLKKCLNSFMKIVGKVSEKFVEGDFLDKVENKT